MGAEADFDLAGCDVSGNDELQRVDVVLKARLGDHGPLGRRKLAFDVARQVGVGGLPAGLRVLKYEPVRGQRVADIVGAAATSKQRGHAAEVEPTAFVERDQVRVPDRSGRACRPSLAYDDLVEQRHFESLACGGLGNRPTCFVALLTLGVPAFERTQEEGVRVDAHGGHIRVCVQGAVAEDELVVDSV